MPEFLARPNVPNALAQSLVQLAAHQDDPIAEAIRGLGAMAHDVLVSRGKRDEVKEDAAQKYAHDKEMKQMEIAAKNKDRGHELLMKLVETGQATPAQSKPLTASDAAMLGAPGFQGPLQSSGQRMTPPAGSYSSENYPGGELPAGYDIKPKPVEKEGPTSYPLTKEMVAKAPSLGALPLGTKIPHKDYIDAVEMEKKKSGEGQDRDMALAEKIVASSNGGAELSADAKTKAVLEVEKKIKAHRRGEKVTFDDIAPPEEPNKESWAEFFSKTFHSMVGAAKSAKDALTPEPKAKTTGSLPGLKITKKKA